MATFTITVTDRPKLAGIALARAAYNAALPTVMDNRTPRQPIIPKPGTVATDAAYLQNRVDEMLGILVRDHATELYEIDRTISDWQAKRAAAVAAGA